MASKLDIDGSCDTAESAASSTQSSTDLVVVTLVAKWGKERILLENLPLTTTIGEVKNVITQRTRILPHRQKLVGLAVDKSNGIVSLNDATILSDLKVKKKASKSNVNTTMGPIEIRHEFILMGTPEEKIFIDPSHVDNLPEVVDDFDLDFNAGSDEWVQHVANGENLRKFTESTAIHVMNEPRPGKPLLVLDLDHTLLDFSSRRIQEASIGPNQNSSHAARSVAMSMKRPFMDEFLTSTYRHYDLVVWSQTSWRWLETKLTELGMLTNPGYRFAFVLDKTSMFSVTSTKRDGTSHRHYVKPLQIIWSKFPQNWGSHNTVHLDDLSRNFALNLGSGLKVSGYYRKKSSSQRDTELSGLAIYLERLALEVSDFEKVDFAKWSNVVKGTASMLPDEKK